MAKRTAPLALCTSVESVITKRRNPEVFYRTTEGIVVRESFFSSVVVNAQTVEAGTPYKADGFDLTSDLRHREIESLLPEQHFFGESILCVLIADLIQAQLDGDKEGALAGRDHPNLFYMQSCVVGVMWHQVVFAQHSAWHVYATLRRPGRNWKGTRVFSPS